MIAAMVMLATFGTTKAEEAAKPSVTVPVLSNAGPDAAAYEGFPFGTLVSASQRRHLVATYSHFDELTPARIVRRATSSWSFQRAAEPEISYTFDGERRKIMDYLNRQPTTGLLIARDDTILYEDYQYVRSEHDRFLSQSMAKTITAMLIGIAAADGAIKSIDDEVATYVTGLAGTEYGKTPIRALLHMSSGVEFKETYDGQDDVARESKRITYRQMHGHVCRLANVLKSHGVAKGDTVTIYLPMIPEAAYAMLACARIGAVHSIVFGGFSPDALAGRIEGCNSKVVITADEGLRGGRKVPLKANADAAAKKAPDIVQTMIVVKRTGGAIDWVNGRDVWYEDEVAKASTECAPTEMNAEDPLFILYTSGSTGAPKGVVHTTGGYLVYASMTHQYVFDYHDGDVYWCTADVDLAI